MSARPLRLTVGAGSGVRPEIQALRAIAVLLVVVYHFWPLALPGGYVGVDVFFVISGFLITAHLLREVDRTGTVRLGAFWARRARRLLPASLFVVVVSAIASLLVVPVTFWIDFFKQMGASIAYVLNWVLAFDSVDYLAAENNASPVQHYWSLSVEEQFYLLWPLLILLAGAAAGKRLARRTTTLVVLLVVTTASFVVSVVMTAAEPALAYFVTPTRGWEFGLGGLLAFAPAVASIAARSIVAWAGVVGIVATGLLFTDQTPFPGYAALLPVLSTAAVIWAGVTTPRWSVAQLSRFRPIQYLGDLSYSLYLWHWPLIVIMPYVLSRDLTGLDAVLLFALSIGLAAVTKQFVEDPGRSAKPLTTRRPAMTLIGTAAAMAVAVALPAGGYLVAKDDRQAGMAQAREVQENESLCVGASVLVDDCEPDDLGDAIVPSLAALKSDTANAYRCYDYDTSSGDSRLKSCRYGPDDGLRVAVTGDSHAAMLVPGLKSHAEEIGWRVDTYVGRGCTWAAGDLDEACAPHRTALAKRLSSGEYDMIIVGAYQAAGMLQSRSADEVAAARAEAWRDAIDAGTDVVVVTDNPTVPDADIDCVVENPTKARSGTACVLTDDERVDAPTDPLAVAAELVPRTHVVDMDDLYCTADGCPMVIGNIAVYRDKHHITGTYAQTVMPTLIERVQKTVGTSR